MKRLLCAVLALLMLLPVFATTAFAAGHGHGRHVQSANQNCTSNQACGNNTDCASNETCTNNCQYADENGDNICDNCNNRCVECGETMDENADGICDYCGKCSHYTDENHDGICDHQAECENRKNAASKPIYTKTGHHSGSHRNHH